MGFRSLRLRPAVWATIAAAIALSAVTAWLVTDNRGHDLISSGPDKSVYPVTGIDISAHNGVVNFDAVVADSIDFVMIKATEGATFKDRAFADNYRRASKAGLKIGVYHFFRFDTPGHMQALNLLHSIKGRQIDLPIAIDVEEWTNPDNESVDAVLARLREMTDYIRLHGYPLIIYTNKNGLERYFKGQPREFPLWVCTFSTPENNLQWKLWQHTHRGNVAGIDGHVDVNTFNGNRSDWKNWLDSLAAMQ